MPTILAPSSNKNCSGSGLTVAVRSSATEAPKAPRPSASGRKSVRRMVERNTNRNDSTITIYVAWTTGWGMPRYRGNMISWKRNMSSIRRIVVTPPAASRKRLIVPLGAPDVVRAVKRQTAAAAHQIKFPTFETTPV